MYVMGEIDVSKIAEYAEPGEYWKDGDFALLLRLLGDGRRVLVEAICDLGDDGLFAGTLLEPVFYDHDCAEIGFLAKSDEANFVVSNFRIVRPTEDVRGRPVMKAVIRSNEVRFVNADTEGQPR